MGLGVSRVLALLASGMLLRRRWWGGAALAGFGLGSALDSLRRD